MEWSRGRAYSQGPRARVLAASDRGLSSRTVAARFAVSVSYVVKAWQRRDRTGEVRALKPRQTWRAAQPSLRPERLVFNGGSRPAPLP